MTSGVNNLEELSLSLSFHIAPTDWISEPKRDGFHLVQNFIRNMTNLKRLNLIFDEMNNFYFERLSSKLKVHEMENKNITLYWKSHRSLTIKINRS